MNGSETTQPQDQMAGSADREELLSNGTLEDRIEDIGIIIWMIFWRIAAGVLMVVAVVVVVAFFGFCANGIWVNYERGQARRVVDNQTHIERQHLEQEALRAYRLR